MLRFGLRSRAGTLAPVSGRHLGGGVRDGWPVGGPARVLIRSVPVRSGLAR